MIVVVTRFPESDDYGAGEDEGTNLDAVQTYHWAFGFHCGYNGEPTVRVGVTVEYTPYLRTVKSFFCLIWHRMRVINLHVGRPEY